MKLFISSPVDVFEGQQADDRLKLVNDSRFVSEGGILRVDAERWQQAQQYERDTWLKYNLETQTDRNEIHREGFDDYKAVPFRLGNYLELGCGPFTNSRFIIGGRETDSVTLIDPLATDYEINHPRCTYKGGRLCGRDVGIVTTTIESLNPDRQWADTIVMINVLPHCYDCLKIFDIIRRILRPGGLLIFHESPRELAPMDIYDVGHPLVVTKAILDDFRAAFEEIYVNGDYFIGRKPFSLVGGKAEAWQTK